MLYYYMLIDTHVHLELEDFDKDREEVIKRAKDAGIDYILTVGSDLEGCHKAVELSQSEPIIYASIGIHPHDVKDIDNQTYEEIKRLAISKKVVAYGEIGLDYHYDLSPRDVQRERFRRQIDIANGLKLPIIVHSREARDDTLKILEEGGAKEVGGIIYDPEAPPEKRRHAFSLFGKGIAPFLKNRIFTPGSDIGTDNNDIQWMLEASGRKRSKRILPSGRSSYYTGLTVFVGAERAAKHLGIEMKGATVAIEGFGRVGSAAARFFTENGAKVVAISTSEGALYNEKGLDVSCLIGELAAKGSAFVSDYKEADRFPKAQLLTLDVDILSPCAKYHTINGTNMYEIKSKIISAGANVPVDNDAIEILHSRPILYLPDFVTNCGGVLGTYIEIAGLPLNRVSSLIPGLIGSKIDEIILNAKERGIPPITYAKEIAMERFHHLKGSAEGKGLFGIALRPSIIRAVRNFIPPFILGKMAKIYIQRYLDRQL